MAKAAVTTNEARSGASRSGPPDGKLVKQVSGQVTGRVTGTIDRSRGFLRDVRSEMRKVVTPSMKEVQSTTTVVLVTVFAFAGFFYVVDGVLGRVIQAALHWMGVSQ